MLQKIVNGQKWVAGKHLRDRGTRSEALLGGSSEGGGVLRISSERDDRIGAKSKTPQNRLGFKQSPNKSPDQNFTPQKFHADFPSHKIFQKGLNDLTRKNRNNSFEYPKPNSTKIRVTKNIPKSKILNPK